MTVEIPLSQGQVAIVDDEDAALIGAFKWYAKKARGGGFYAMRDIHANGIKTRNSIHREILGVPGLVVDHIDGNGLNNTRRNLRVCSQAKNVLNRHGANRNNTSGHSGVAWSAACQKWQASIGLNRRQHHLGVFAELEDAIAARVTAEQELFGEFAPQRSVPQEG